MDLGGVHGEQTVLKDDPSHSGALYEYSLLALGHGFTNDALQILLKLLVAMPVVAGCRKQGCAISYHQCPATTTRHGYSETTTVT
jgi:hypothetical protein